MLELLAEIVKNLGKGLGTVLLLAFDSIGKVTSLISKIFDHRVEKEKQEKMNQNNKDLKDVCDNGTLEDLISPKIVIFYLIIY